MSKINPFHKGKHKGIKKKSPNNIKKYLLPVLQEVIEEDAEFLPVLL